MTDGQIDLTAGTFKVLGNKNDDHIFRLSNAPDQTLIEAGVEYLAEFISSSGSPSPVVVDESDLDTGVLTIPVHISSGTYRLWRTNPNRTLLVLEVSTK